jgi:hypothetical protein
MPCCCTLFHPVTAQHTFLVSSCIKGVCSAPRDIPQGPKDDKLSLTTLSWERPCTVSLPSGLHRPRVAPHGQRQGEDCAGIDR